MTRGKYLLEVYGCQMNLADGELVRGLIEADGWQPTAEAGEADLILINTCGVRERAAERVIGHIRSLRPLKQRHPGLRIALLGCLARYGGEDLIARLPEVDLFLGPDAYRSLPARLREVEEPPFVDTRQRPEETYAGVSAERAPGVHAWLSVMRGCNRMCSYCMVPFARGRERSLPAGALLDEAREIAAHGFRSVTLLGQTVTSYRDGERDFAWLLEAIAGIEGLARIRFLSPHPADFTPRLLETIARLPRVCRHLHLPVQSGSDRVLAAMRRGYTRGEYLDLVARARALLPGLALTTDLIVGFPGEGEGEFADTLELMRAIEFDSAFMFAYSSRPGTYAARALSDDVPPEIKRERLEAMIALQEEHARRRYGACVGREVEVLIEKPARAPEGAWFGRSDDFKDVVVTAEDALPPQPGDLVRARVAEASSHTLRARRV